MIPLRRWSVDDTRLSSSPSLKPLLSQYQRQTNVEQPTASCDFSKGVGDESHLSSTPLDAASISVIATTAIEQPNQEIANARINLLLYDER